MCSNLTVKAPELTSKHLLEVFQNALEKKELSSGPATLLKKRLWHWCFSVNFAPFLRKPFFKRTPPVAVSAVSHFISSTYLKILLFLQ